MRLVIDLSTGSADVSLAEGDDFSKFHVEVIGTADPDRLDAALRTAEVGQLDGADAIVEIDALRRLPAQRGPEWDEGLAGMVADAGEKGLLEDDGGAIRARVVVT